MKVKFIYKNGRERVMDTRYADILKGLKLGTYRTRDVTTSRIVAVPPQSEEPKSEETEAQVADDASVADGLDDLEVDELRAIAKDRGVRVHHAAGADKIRAALRGAAE